MGACRFNRRSGTAKLPASTLIGATGAEVEVLTAQAVGGGDAAWRIVDLWSDAGLPWTARVVWLGGGGATRSVTLDVPNATRVCVPASMVQVFGSNLSNTVNIAANAAIADGQCDTTNQLTVRGSVNGQGLSVPVTPPAWASLARLELSDSTLLGSAFLEMVDAANVVRGRIPASQQVPPGVPLGDAASVRAVLPAGTFAWRIVFQLHL